MSSFGFTYLSRKALGQAEQIMFGAKAGVRDEVGFLLIHQRYANHFFPGTSVLHTRLRYALFLPWIYQSLRNMRTAPKDFAQAFIDLEHQLTGRLTFAEGLGGEKDGVIGADIYPRAISQPPSYAYWSALAKWGMISPRADDRPWSRADMAKLLAAARKPVLHDDDGKPFETMIWPIPDLPPPPANWDIWGKWEERFAPGGAGKLSLTMTLPEQTYMARKLRAVHVPGNPTEPSLLAKLVGKPLDGVTHCWDEEILSLAGSDAAMLQRAGQAAALAAVGRAVYAALVETLKHNKDKRPQPDLHRAALKDCLAIWGEQAAALDMNLFAADMGKIPAPVIAALEAASAWLRAGKSDPELLLAAFARAEISRKGDRARLADNQFGVDRRMEWQGGQHGKPDPLYYRWDNVKRLLKDLEEAA